MSTDNFHVQQLASFHDTNQLYLNLTEALATLNVRQTVSSPRGFNRARSDNELITYHGKSVWDVLDKVWFSRKVDRYMNLLASSNNAGQVDLTHAHSLYSDGVAAYKLWRMNGTPYVITIRNTDLFIFSKYYVHLRKLARLVLANASHVIFVNPHYADKLAQLLNISFEQTKISVIPNGLDAYWLTDHSTFSGNTSDALNILSVAHVIPLKNHETLITGINQHNQGRSPNQPELQLTIVGRCDKGYGKKIRNKHESDTIRFVGSLPFDKIAEQIGKSDIFALVSKPENFGIAYAEAVSQGLPVIYTENEGFDGWVDEGIWGYSCPVHSPDAFIERVLRIGKNHRLNQSAIDTARTLFDWNVIGRSVYDIYENALR